jgi:hypothetical protein
MCQHVALAIQYDDFVMGDVSSEARPEAWLRGPVAGVPEALQPVAHALLQAREDVHAIGALLPSELLWTRPAGVASAGFHLQHVSGVIDRLFTYARGELLAAAQLQALKQEGRPTTGMTIAELLEAFDSRVGLAIEQLRNTDVRTLANARAVGRAGLPSNVLGLLVHAAEHVQRHVGQLLVTVRVQLPDDGPQE